MKNFDEIIANIQKELLELKEINNSLREENASLRKQIGISARNDDLSLENVFNNFSLKNDASGLKTATRSSLCRAGCRNLGDFRNESIIYLVKDLHISPSRCAILIVLLEHYNIPIKLPNLESIVGCCESRKIKMIYEKLPEYRERIKF